MGLSPKPWFLLPRPLAWLNPASSLPVSGPGRGRRAVRRGSHCPGCPHRELSSPVSLHSPSLCRESWGRGTLHHFCHHSPSPSQPGRASTSQPGTPNPLPAWTPSPPEHFWGCSQHSINSLQSFSLLCHPLFSVWKLCSSAAHRGVHPAMPVSSRRNVHPTIPPQTCVEGYRMTPGAWIMGLLLVVLAGFQHSCSCWCWLCLQCSACHGQGKPNQHQCRSSLPKPSGTQEGSPRNGGVGWEDAQASGIIKSSSTNGSWSAPCLFLLGAGTGEQHPLLQPAPAALLLEYRKEFPLLNINIPVAKCIQM